jgi:hypothetical protein
MTGYSVFKIYVFVNVQCYFFLGFQEFRFFDLTELGI